MHNTDNWWWRQISIIIKVGRKRECAKPTKKVSVPILNASVTEAQGTGRQGEAGELTQILPKPRDSGSAYVKA